MKYQQKMTRFEQKEVRSKKLEEALAGEGLYLYRNAHKADVTLPRPTKSGRRIIGPNEEFQGDNYYMQLVRTGELRFVRELQSPQQQEAAMNKEKLILDQPDTVTSEGTVEHVSQSEPVQPLQEGGEQEKKDVLINEAPVDDDGFVIVED